MEYPATFNIALVIVLLHQVSVIRIMSGFWSFIKNIKSLILFVRLLALRYTMFMVFKSFLALVVGLWWAQGCVRSVPLPAFPAVLSYRQTQGDFVVTGVRHHGGIFNSHINLLNVLLR